MTVELGGIEDMTMCLNSGRSRIQKTQKLVTTK